MPNRNQQGRAEQYATGMWNHIDFIEGNRRAREVSQLLPEHLWEPAFGHHCTRCGCPVGPASNWTCIPCHGMVEVACNVRISRDRDDGFRSCKLHDGPLYEEDQWWKRKELGTTTK